MPAPYEQRVLIYQDDPNEPVFAAQMGGSSPHATATEWLTWVLDVNLIENPSGTYTCILYNSNNVPVDQTEITV